MFGGVVVPSVSYLSMCSNSPRFRTIQAADRTLQHTPHA